MAQRISFVVEGVVQGVGFRYFTRNAAQEYGITGWCRNTPDNKVEGEAQGDEGPMAKFIADVQKGPRHSNVTNFTQKDTDVVDGESSFKVTR